MERPAWHKWASAGYRLLEHGGALDRHGAQVPEDQLEAIAGELHLPWPSSGLEWRPAPADADALLDPFDAVPVADMQDEVWPGRFLRKAAGVSTEPD